MTRIALLHTSLVFVTVEPLITDLIARQLPDAEIIHFIDSDVLTTVQREGHISAASRERMLYLAKAAEAADAGVIFSLCSSLGPAVDAAAAQVRPPVVKIDDAMAREAARRGGTVAVLGTVHSTLAPTAELVLHHARALGTDVRVLPELCEGAFAELMAGHRDRHDELVTQHVLHIAPAVDTVVLAQASMSRLAGPLERAAGVSVLASPELGVRDLARVVTELS